MDHDFNADLDRTYAALNASHLAFHRMEPPGPDSDTVLLAFTERDLLLFGMALPALELLFLQSGIDCFHEPSGELQTRVMEIVRVQRPEWVVAAPDSDPDDD